MEDGQHVSCSADGKINGSNYIGSICGQNNSLAQISGCSTNNSNVASVVSTYSYIGGLCGYNSGIIDKSSVTNCEITNLCEPERKYFVHRNDGAIENCFTVDSMMPEVSRVYNSYQIFDNTITVYNKKCADKTYNMSELANSKIYDGFDFSGVWTMNNDGPKLKAVNKIEKDEELPTTYWKTANSFAGGKGTKSNPYLIATAEQLVKAVKSMMSGIYYRVINDIDLEGKLWPTEVDSSGYYLVTCYFDGNNKTISNLTMKNGSGLFECDLRNGYIKNLNLINIKGSSSAGLVPYISNSEISNCTVTGSLKAAICYNSGVFMSQNVGALSEIALGSNVSIQNCTIDMDIKGYRQVSSVISIMDSETLNMNNCGIQGAIFGMSEDVFGIHSESDYKIKNTYVSVLTKGFVKGKEVLYNSDLCEGNGIPLTTEQMKSKSSYKNFDFENTWALNPKVNNGLPYLKPSENKKINYVLNGGTNVAYPESDYIPGNVVVLQKPTKTGYTFDGWYKSADFSGDPITQISSSENSDITLYAKWTCTHSWNSGDITKPATCTANGVKTYTCERCNKTKTETIAATGHNFDNAKVTQSATCTEEGLKTYYCKNCDATKIESIAKTAHTYKTTTTKATTKKNGSKVTKCSVCGDKKSSSTIYAIKTVSLSATSYTYEGKAKQPSVTVKDSKGKKIASRNYTVKYSNNKNVGKATVTITFKGNYSGTVKKTFTIKPKATTLSSLTTKTKGFTAKWKKLTTQTTGYEIQYSTSSKFSGAKTVTVSKNKTTSKTISKLKAKKKYYVRIRTYKTVGKTKIYSSWSKSKAVTTKK